MRAQEAKIWEVEYKDLSESPKAKNHFVPKTSSIQTFFFILESRGPESAK